MKKERTLSILIFMLLIATGFTVAATYQPKETLLEFPPEIQWQNTFGSERIDWGNCVQQTTDGGYIISGTYYRNTWSLWYSYYYLIKTDANGNEEWNQTYGIFDRENVGKCVQETNDGGYIIAGYEGVANHYDGIPPVS